MEQGKGKWSSSSSSSSSSPPPCSITELFNKKESPAAGIIGILFPPQSKVPGEHSLHSDMVDKSQDSPNQPWNTKHGTTTGHEVDSIYKEQRVQQPFHLSSSIFYGGQDDVYTPPKSNRDSLSKGYKDIGVDDSEFASRGNWWQGSLYY